MRGNIKINLLTYKNKKHMIKEEVIQKAYGIKYDLLKEHIDENGWISQNKVFRSIFRSLDIDDRTNSMRPLELKGIENNNGWIKINSDDDLPKETPIDVIINNNPYQGYVYSARSTLLCILENRYKSECIDDCVEAELITHYLPIVKPKNPIY